MFKPRSASASSPAASPPSIELVRQRAKHRLLGVSVLVVAGVVLFPLMFDTQPRPIPVDIAIDIPSRQSVKPLAVDSVPARSSEVVQKPVTAPEEETVISGSGRAMQPQSPTESPPATVRSPAATTANTAPESVKKIDKPPATPSAQTASKAPASPAPAASTSKVAGDAEAARALALLNGKSLPSDSKNVNDVTGRFIVQVGAFADSARAQQVRNQLEKAGLKTYTHVADTAEGKRIRVRLGPFSTRADADKAASRAKGLGLPAAVLTL